MISDYPDFDPAPEAAWREQRAALYTLTTESTAQLEALQAGLGELQTRRSANLDAAARGDAVPADAHRTIEDEIRTVELDILHVSELLKRRNAMLAEHDKTSIAARAQAHRPRILHAIRELRESGLEIDAARRAMAAADRRAHEAREVLRQAWGAGHPLPPAFMPLNGNIYQGEKLMAELGELQIRRNFGPYADEALGSPVTEAA